MSEVNGSISRVCMVARKSITELLQPNIFLNANLNLLFFIPYMEQFTPELQIPSHDTILMVTVLELSGLNVEMHV